MATSYHSPTPRLPRLEGRFRSAMRFGPRTLTFARGAPPAKTCKIRGGGAAGTPSEEWAGRAADPPRSQQEGDLAFSHTRADRVDTQVSLRYRLASERTRPR